ncbi:HesA/MoeB/ThiF family protein [Methanobacterium alkalithermotolerans]|uniref:HesA/MoeB/ThiF family protein n=1 Tax=Methanobacterium alkalithermotolerans TaxID=2731220 RepID=A0A8T8K4X5_9EURY|nr:HesA/MoeB/ThiF family protein [Methanobacterium alkalithermotolerans]QUH23564.1 HesA/MoeB/ThiF family protein [Methanobacterium alkalithermotolerans]RJS48658.1 MAG: molybdopterin biosynthesis protein MoeB [Methanobacterium sp.]
MPKRYEGMTYWEIVSRQMGILTKSQQLRLKDSEITVIGCGGIGGAVLEMLVRMGVGSLRIIDKDDFDVSNINRQLMSSFYTVGQSKARVTQDIIRSINPFVKVMSFEEELDSRNVEKIVKGSTLVIDALDNLVSRVIVSRCALKFDIPFIHGAIHGTMGQVSVFNQDTPSYEELFQLPSIGSKLNEEVIEKLKEMGSEVPPVIGPVPNIVGCLQAFEAVKLITMEGEPIMAPDVLMFDLLGKDPFSIVKF